jgi:hypothetical protein
MSLRSKESRGAGRQETETDGCLTCQRTFEGRSVKGCSGLRFQPVDATLYSEVIT